MSRKHVVIVFVAWLLSLVGTERLASAAESPADVDVQVPLLSEVGQPAKPAHSLLLGEGFHNAVVLHLNVDDVRHVLLQPNDLQDATLTLHVEGSGARAGKLVLYRLVRELASPAAASQSDMAAEPVADADLHESGLVQLRGSLAAVLKQDLADPTQDHGLLLTAQGTHGALELRPVPAPMAVEAGHFASLSIEIHRYPKADLFSPPLRPMPGVYTQVQDGHLTYNGQRLRLWGVCRHFWGGQAVVDRLYSMGFNAIRLWGPRNAYTPQSANRGEMVADEGSLDAEDSLANFDKFFAEAKAKGFFIWMCGLHYDPLGIMHKSATNGLDGIVADDSFLAKKFGTGADWDAWKQATTSYLDSKKSRTAHEVSELMFFDPRLKEIYRRQLVNLLNHVNPYTGKRYAEDEAIANWELNNEEGFNIYPTLYADQNDWPQYFRDELQTQWCQWLTKRYGTDANLRQAWGELKPGETLDGGHIHLAPAARNRAEYPTARADDEVHFLCDIVNAFNQEMHSLIRAQAPAGVGAAVVPVTFDTIAEPSAAWAFTESLGDVMSFGTYQFTFHSSLTVPPALYIMDNHSVWRKPTLIYETQCIRPDPFRTEYPLRVAALAGWQDWDGVFFHYWKGGTGLSDESYDASPLDLPGQNYTDGGVYPEQDPAYSASLAIAGQAFISGGIAPAKHPVIYQIPLNKVFSLAFERGIPMRRETFSRGAYMTFGPTDNVPTQPPPTVADLAFPKGPVHAGDEITYDWQNGRMIIDTPTTKAYVGQPHGAYRFADGIVLEKVSTPFITFAMVSDDGKPLTGPNATRRINLTAQWDAQNTNFHLDLGRRRGGESSGWNQSWSNAMAAAITNRGTAPVRNAPVSYQIDFPTQLNAHWADYDFARRQIADETIDSNQLRHEAGSNNAFMSVLTINSRGAEATTPQSSSPQADDPQAPSTMDPLDLPDPQFASLYVPLPLVGWGESYDAVQEYLVDSTVVCGSMNKELATPAHQGSIQLTQASPLVDLHNLPPADIQLTFADHRLNRIVATFNNAQPSPATLEHAFDAMLGAPSQKGEETIWRQSQGEARLTVTAATQKGHATITWEVK